MINNRVLVIFVGLWKYPVFSDIRFIFTVTINYT